MYISNNKDTFREIMLRKYKKTSNFILYKYLFPKHTVLASLLLYFLSASTLAVWICVHSNSSNADTVGTEQTVLNRGMSAIQELVCGIENDLGSRK